MFTSNEAGPAAGDWYYIKLDNTSDDATTVLEHCVVEYAGGSQGAIYMSNASPTIAETTIRHSKYAAIYANNSSPALTNCTLADNNGHGLYLSGGSPVLNGCSFSNNGNFDLYYSGTVGGTVTGCTINNGIYISSGVLGAITANTINYNAAYPIRIAADGVGELMAQNTLNNLDTASLIEVNTDTIERDATWSSAIKYLILGNLTVKGTDGADGITTLTLEPGAELRMTRYRQFTVGASSGDPGALRAQGTAADPILFTSNEAGPAAGDWYYIKLDNTSDDASTIMQHCVVEYAGGSQGALYLTNASPTIANTTFRYSKNAGIYASGTGNGTATVYCNTFTGNKHGIHWAASPPPEMHSNNFSGNTDYGIYYTGAATLNAEDNWWGDTDGPNTGGDSTYGNVDGDPWSSVENQCVAQVENNPPNEPNMPNPTDGAVRIDVTSGLELQWTGGDPDLLDTVLYDLYRGTSVEGLSLLAQDIGSPTYQMTDAAQGQTYYWKIIAKDNRGLETSGPVWQFTTNGDPPDLIVSSLSIDPAGNLQQGQTVIFTAEITNVGLGPVVDAFDVDFKINGTAIGNQSINTILMAGESFTVSQTWTYDTGDPTISVVADGQFAVTESLENNNQYIILISELADNTAPTMASHSPANGSHQQQIQNISATLIDAQSSVDDAAVIMSFLVTDEAQQPVAGTTVEANDTFTFTPSNLPLLDGTYDVSMTAADTLGNQQLYQFSFVIDTQPPTKPVVTGSTVASGTIQPRPAANQADDFMAPLEGTRDAGTSLWINGIKFAPAGLDHWSVDLTLQLGDNALEIWCLDQAGNRSASEWVDIYVDPASGLIFDYNGAGRMKRTRRIQ